MFIYTQTQIKPKLNAGQVGICIFKDYSIIIEIHLQYKKIRKEAYLAIKK